MKHFIITLLLLAGPTFAGTVATFQDVESIEAAQERLGTDDIEVGDLKRYDRQVSNVGTRLIISAAEPSTVTPVPIEPAPVTTTSKAQLNGCLDRVNNQLNSPLKTAINSLFSSRQDKEILQACIDDMRLIIKSTN